MSNNLEEIRDVLKQTQAIMTRYQSSMVDLLRSQRDEARKVSSRSRGEKQGIVRNPFDKSAQVFKSNIDKLMGTMGFGGMFKGLQSLTMKIGEFKGATSAARAMIPNTRSNSLGQAGDVAEAVRAAQEARSKKERFATSPAEGVQRSALGQLGMMERLRVKGLGSDEILGKLGKKGEWFRKDYGEVNSANIAKARDRVQANIAKLADNQARSEKDASDKLVKAKKAVAEQMKGTNWDKFLKSLMGNDRVRGGILGSIIGEIVGHPRMGAGVGAMIGGEKMAGYAMSAGNWITQKFAGGLSDDKLEREEENAESRKEKSLHRMAKKVRDYARSKAQSQGKQMGEAAEGVGGDGVEAGAGIGAEATEGAGLAVGGEAAAAGGEAAVGAGAAGAAGAAGGSSVIPVVGLVVAGLILVGVAAYEAGVKLVKMNKEVVDAGLKFRNINANIAQTAGLNEVRQLLRDLSSGSNREDAFQFANDSQQHLEDVMQPISDVLYDMKALFTGFFTEMIADILEPVKDMAQGVLYVVHWIKGDLADWQKRMLPDNNLAQLNGPYANLLEVWGKGDFHKTQEHFEKRKKK